MSDDRTRKFFDNAIDEMTIIYDALLANKLPHLAARLQQAGFDVDNMRYEYDSRIEELQNEVALWKAQSGADSTGMSDDDWKDWYEQFGHGA